MFGSMALHGAWIVFIGTLILGESVVLAAAALAATGTWSVWSVAGWAFAGTVVADVAWFTSASKALDRWRDDPARRERLERAARRVDRLAGTRPHRALLFVKFLYGTRIASLVYMATRGVERRTFVVFDAAGTAVWLAVVVPVGWAIGAGASSLGVELKRAEVALGVIVVAALAVKGAGSWLRSRRAG